MSKEQKPIGAQKPEWIVHCRIKPGSMNVFELIMVRTAFHEALAFQAFPFVADRPIQVMFEIIKMAAYTSAGAVAVVHKCHVGVDLESIQRATIKAGQDMARFLKSCMIDPRTRQPIVQWGEGGELPALPDENGGEEKPKLRIITDA